MNIERTAQTLLGVAALCLLLVNAGCNSVPSSVNTGNTGENSGGPGGAPTAFVQNNGDWGASLLANGTVGVGMFPAKFTFDVTAPPSCPLDYVAFNTSIAGITPSAAATQTGNWTAVATSGTVTIGSPEATLVLTASTTLNTGLNFQVITSATVEATNLAAAINRNNFATLGAGHVRVRATSSAGQVSVFASSDGITNLNGAEGSLITLAQTINGGDFTWNLGRLAGGAGEGNIVAFNQLYSTQDSAGGLCAQDGPSAYWAYYTGTGSAVTSVVLSGDGSKVAYVENVGGTQAWLRILKWKAGEGAGAGYPHTVDQDISGANWSTCTAGNSCIASIAFAAPAATDTNSAPFYDYNTDTIYVGDNSGRMNKFTGVFLGTPAVAGAPWPITVHAGDILTSPVYDGNSGNIFVGDNTGRLSFIQEVGSTVGGTTTCNPTPVATACLNTISRQVGTAGTIVDAPIVDGVNQTVFAVNGQETLNHGSILQASTGLTGAVTFNIGSNLSPGSVTYSGAFDNTYYNSLKGATAGHMYVCGKDHTLNDRPSIYQLSFAAATGVLTSVGAPLVGLVTASQEQCSPVTEFFNGGTSTDWIFFSIGNRANDAAPMPVGGPCGVDNGGCVISINVTGNPAWPPAAVTLTKPVVPSFPANNEGSTSGIVVDNQSGSAQASSFYFTLETNSTGVGPGVPSCNTTAGIGCAVKLTQSGLN